MRQKFWITLITCLAYCIDQELYNAIDYLKEQVRVLLEQQQKDKRVLLNNPQRRRLAAKARKLTRKLLEETTVLFIDCQQKLSGNMLLVEIYQAGVFLGAIQSPMTGQTIIVTVPTVTIQVQPEVK